MRPRTLPVAGLVGLSLLAACREQGQSDSAGFPERAIQELGALRLATSPAEWLPSHPRDRLETFTPGLASQNDSWCALARREDTLPGGARLVRDAYFYPPDPPVGLALPPDTEGPSLVARYCRLGAIWLETPQPDSQIGVRLALQTKRAMSSQFAREVTFEDPLGPGPGGRFGPAFSGSARWTAKGRWEDGAVTAISAYDRAFGEANRSRVLVVAFLPISRFGMLDSELDGHAEQYGQEAALVGEAARLSGLDQSKVTRLMSVLAQAESAFTERTHPNLPALKSAAVATLGEWLGSARSLDAARRAPALLSADRVLANQAVVYVLAQDEDSATREALQALGAHFVYAQLGATYVYTHTWLNEALRLDPDGRAGVLAFMSLARAGFDTTGMCEGGFSAVIERGEQFIPRLRDTTLKAELHVLVGDAHADIVGLAAGLGQGYADTGAYVARAPEARAKAVAHYRAGLALDHGSAMARRAWLGAWRLLAGLPPSTTHFFCVYD